jgi:hypothetical protein
MKIIRKCPICNSTRIKGTISIQNGNYLQKISCNKCLYHGIKNIGSAIILDRIENNCVSLQCLRNK